MFLSVAPLVYICGQEPPGDRLQLITASPLSILSPTIKWLQPSEKNISWNVLFIV